MGSNIYLANEAPRYPTGYGASFGFADLGIICCLALEYLHWHINKCRAARAENEVREQYTEEEVNRMGDRSPPFKYRLYIGILQSLTRTQFNLLTSTITPRLPDCHWLLSCQSSLGNGAPSASSSSISCLCFLACFIRSNRIPAN